jgi:hypothetical protein
MRLEPLPEDIRIVPAVHTTHDPLTGEWKAAHTYPACAVFMAYVALFALSILASVVLTVIAAVHVGLSAVAGIGLAYLLYAFQTWHAWRNLPQLADVRKCPDAVQALRDLTGSGTLGPVVHAEHSRPCWITEGGYYQGSVFTKWGDIVAFRLTQPSRSVNLLTLLRRSKKRGLTGSTRVVNRAIGYVATGLLLCTALIGLVSSGVTVAVVAALLPLTASKSLIIVNKLLWPRLTAGWPVPDPISGRTVDSWMMVHPKACSEQELREMLSRELIDEEAEAPA